MSISPDRQSITSSVRVATLLARKPFIMMMPKSLLRHRRCKSSVVEAKNTGLRRVLKDNVEIKPIETLSLTNNDRAGTVLLYWARSTMIRW
jgi:2-oxoglutarate dehydrogenase complex dehydrogenase (E1) component-like enzyme